MLLLVNKPKGWTSFDVVNKVRNTIGKAFPSEKKIKVGHAGTLDPLATGLLILGTGAATRQMEALQGLDKIYSGRIHLGQVTDSYDGETPPGPSSPIEHISLDQIRTAAEQLSGEQMQIPPQYSAIKVDGRRSYRAARKGQRTNLEARAVRIEQFDIQAMEGPELLFRVHCSKGTYIRSLAHDLGQVLGVGAWLSALQRDAIGSYTLQQARSLEELLDYIAQCGAGIESLDDSREKKV